MVFPQSQDRRYHDCTVTQSHSVDCDRGRPFALGMAISRQSKLGPDDRAIAVNGGLVLWTVDEIVRGVNRWRRSLGAVVLLYEFTTLFNDGTIPHAGAGAQMSPRACIVTAPAGLARL